MKWLLATVALALAACSGIDEPAGRAVVDRFHVALNAGDYAAIDGLLSTSARNIRPGGGTARAFRAITARHGRYQGGKLTSITAAGDRTTLRWSARYDGGTVAEVFVLAPEGGGLKIESYTDKPSP